jgi:3-methylcrotonyl-CoA carboxylase alpha subunit
MFTKILVANRGQIAVRVMHTCHELGIRTIGVYTQADRQSPHVFLADEAYPIGEKNSAYSDAEAILQIANKSGAEAIHPGYGLLSDDSAFVEACQQQKITFVGPDVTLLRQATNRRFVREAAHRLNIPVIPEGKVSAATKIPDAKAEAARLGYPLVLKPVFGSGRGMRFVNAESEFQAAFENARRESYSHFGSYEVLMEKFIPEVRFIDVPLIGDRFGHYVLFPERDGSIQRKQNPMLEESPAFGLPAQVREEVRQYARMLAREVKYVGLGSCQFLFSQLDQKIYFLEMSTELGPNYPVTETSTVVDLVELQLRVAAGERLPFEQEFIPARGVAVACRIAAEDPMQDFVATTGTLRKVSEPRGPGIRVDSGMYEGQPVQLQRDPILAQVVAHAYDRPRALSRLRRALDETVILGVDTNLSFLAEVVSHPEFATRPPTTLWLAQRMHDWEPPSPPNEALLAIAIADALAEERDGVFAYRAGHVRREVSVTRQGKQYLVEIDGQRHITQVDPFTVGSIRVISQLRPGQDIWADFAIAGASRYVSIGGRPYLLTRES